MKPKRYFRGVLVTFLSLGVLALAPMVSMGSKAADRDDRDSFRVDRDSLFVGEASDNSVRRFDAKTGKYQAVFVAPGGGGLNGPRAIIFGPNGDLLVINQNVSGICAPPLPPPGEVLRFSASGSFLSKLVPADDPHAPAFPRGAVLWNNKILFVADFSTTLDPCAELEDMAPGRILAYRLKESRNAHELKAEFLAALSPPVAQFAKQFNPRGLVIGPDGLLYVSNVRFASYPLGGDVLRFNPKTLRFVDVFVSSDSGGDFGKLNRPEGLVFSPHGNLYITGYRNDCTDTDKILIFHGPDGRHAGAFLDQIVLANPSCPAVEPDVRAYGVTMLFGPNGRLFIPITASGPDTGSVRRYDVAKKTFDVFVRSSAKGGPLPAPWYLTFGKTDPATLQYQDGRDHNDRWSDEY